VNLHIEGTLVGLRAVKARPEQRQLGPRPPHRVALALAGAHKLQQRIDGGEFAGRMEVARALGLLRARISQLLDLTLLAPDIQEEVLGLREGDLPITEWDLRWVLGATLWVEQRGRWAEVKQPSKADGPTRRAFSVSSRRRQQQ